MRRAWKAFRRRTCQAAHLEIAARLDLNDGLRALQWAVRFGAAKLAARTAFPHMHVPARIPTMPYPEMMVAPMRQDLVRLGFQELRTAEQVDQAMAAMEGTVLLAVNSVCGCAAGVFRPAVMQALESDKRPDHKVTVFAGQDTEATAQARKQFVGYPPSSPSIGLLKDGDVVFMLERFQIEGRSVDDIASDLATAFHEHC